MVSIIVLCHNRVDFTRDCLQAIRAHTAEPYELIVVDNGSTDDTPAFLQAQPDVRCILNPENRGFPAGCNQGAAVARGDRLLLLNNDMLVVPRWLTNLLACQEATGAGLVGPCCNHISGSQRVPVTYQDTGADLLRFAEAFTRPDPSRWRRTTRLGGGGLLLTSQAWETTGGLDERFSPGNYEDDDICLKALVAGIPVYIAGDSFVHHHGGNVFRPGDSGFAALLERNAMRFCEKWGMADPALLYGHPALAALVPDAAQQVLDCACGAGALGLQVKQRGIPWVEGLEATPVLASAACHQLDRVTAGPQATAELAPASFDCVLLPDLLEHLADPWEFLRRVAGWLRPGGAVVLTVTNAASAERVVRLLQGRWPYRQDVPLRGRQLRFFTGAEIGQALAVAGFTVQTVLGEQRQLNAAEQRLAAVLTVLLPDLGAENPALAAQLATATYLVRAVKAG